MAALLLAMAAILRAQSVSRRLGRLTELYWELRYENGQTKARVTQLEIAAGLREAESEAPRPAAPAATSFVPLSSLKK